MKRFDLCKQARKDLRDIHVYIFTQSGEERADMVVREILSKVLMLSQSSSSGTRRNELQRGLHSFPVCSYLIFYRIRPWGIQVSRIIHGARDLPTIFSKKRK